MTAFQLWYNHVRTMLKRQNAGGNLEPATAKLKRKTFLFSRLGWRVNRILLAAIVVNQQTRTGEFYGQTICPQHRSTREQGTMPFPARTPDKFGWKPKKLSNHYKANASFEAFFRKLGTEIH